MAGLPFFFLDKRASVFVWQLKASGQVRHNAETVPPHVEVRNQWDFNECSAVTKVAVTEVCFGLAAQWHSAHNDCSIAERRPQQTWTTATAKHTSTHTTECTGACTAAASRVGNECWCAAAARPQGEERCICHCITALQSCASWLHNCHELD